MPPTQNLSSSPPIPTTRLPSNTIAKDNLKTKRALLPDRATSETMSSSPPRPAPILPGATITIAKAKPQVTRTRVRNDEMSSSSPQPRERPPPILPPSRGATGTAVGKAPRVRPQRPGHKMRDEVMSSSPPQPAAGVHPLTRPLSASGSKNRAQRGGRRDETPVRLEQGQRTCLPDRQQQPNPSTAISKQGQAPHSCLPAHPQHQDSPTTHKTTQGGRKGDEDEAPGSCNNMDSGSRRVLTRGVKLLQTMAELEMYRTWSREFREFEGKMGGSGVDRDELREKWYARRKEMGLARDQNYRFKKLYKLVEEGEKTRKSVARGQAKGLHRSMARQGNNGEKKEGDEKQGKGDEGVHQTGIKTGGPKLDDLD